jgi:predicted aspartyl protease
MGQFRAPVHLTGPTGRTEEVELLVHTGALLVALPRALADRLELVTERHQRVMVAGGATTTLPVAEVRLALGDQHVTTPCFIIPEGAALLGAVALESLFLAVDPVRQRLVPAQALI